MLKKELRQYKKKATTQEAQASSLRLSQYL